MDERSWVDLDLFYGNVKQKYSEKSENIIGLDPYILNSFSYLDPI